MSTTRGDHGTRGRYVMGCRCPLCTKANSDDTWARKKLVEWEDGLLDRGEIKSIVLMDSDIVVTKAAICDAIALYTNEIKLAALIMSRPHNVKKAS